MNKQTHRDLRHRLLSARGHMAMIVSMLERDEPCENILRQTLAVRAAMAAINRTLWRAYLLDSGCGLRAHNAKRRARAWQELRAVVSTR